ncbi:heparinase II/III family protein [Nitratireductor aquimarinus]|uniref:heparinase II/III domain-containing protein n=1 Tax=Nitratireductor TaxID=245876 RepID=UPI0019D35F4B|nr:MULTISPECIES: heparinase II/III family protein [Nitratireductor]MBN7777787.1 heparinase II/III family protein [Nitratireductor pacificus]MBN7781781.1 heparinase II/III family protein [Nitratireductor pacificus]MBN7790587.1 heparinase II/III family protein [Nitratireductor aquimarinus]MBY6099997.1 heparinase II/III-family protein [Nitratireductor aquimarinus]MCA1260461.1 heparinase II/III-family protein [Nitratireductor aquimarinus]
MPMNNHGMMVASSLLHACAVLDVSQKSGLMAKAEGFLSEMFTTVFDRNGFCNENTIGYHDFYRKSLTQLLDFCETFDLAHTSALIREHLPNIESALHKAVWVSGGIPPIGDSAMYLTKYKSTLGLHSFDTGLTVHKDKDTYLSVICGSLSETHKHMDDSSITLRHKETDLIIDSGSYNYDWNDPYRQCLSSARGHSGLSFEEIDTMPRGNFHREHGVSYAATSTVTSKEPPTIECKYTIASVGLEAHRTVEVSSGNSISISDRYSGSPSAIQRYIVPGSASISLFGRSILVQNGDISMAIRTNSKDISIVKGQKGQIYKGWFSPRYGEIEPAYCIEIRNPSSNEMKTRIFFGEGRDGVPDVTPVGWKFRFLSALIHRKKFAGALV